MSLVKIKGGVQPKALTILAAIANVAQSWTEPGEIVITSGMDGKHMKGSKHKTGGALDVRSKTFPSAQSKRDFLIHLRQRLGPHFDLILEDEGGENEHFHCEFDPKDAG